MTAPQLGQRREHPFKCATRFVLADGMMVSSAATL